MGWLLFFSSSFFSTVRFFLDTIEIPRSGGGAGGLLVFYSENERCGWGGEKDWICIRCIVETVILCIRYGAGVGVHTMGLYCTVLYCTVCAYTRLVQLGEINQSISQSIV